MALDLADGAVRSGPVRYAARARTDRGRRWLRGFAPNRETLPDAGFGVSESYPV